MLLRLIRNRFTRVSAALLLAVTAACAPAVLPSTTTLASAPAPVYPGAEWERIAVPETVGWSSEGLEAVRGRLSTMSSEALMAVVGGRVMFEYGDVETVSYLASVRKSILSMMFGRYVADGTANVDRTIGELGIDDHQSLSERERQATVRHLLSARSGVYHPASNAGDDLASAPPRGSQAPGAYHLYSNWDFNAVGTAFEILTGRDIFDALRTDLAEPLGMRDFDRSRHEKSGDLTRSRHPAYHMHLSTRDMARIGYLMLREGEWNGRQIVPRDWVRESTRPVTRRTEMNPERRRDGRFGYGYLWWVFDRPDQNPAYDGAYVGLGAVGQHILVVPALDLVVVHKTVPGEGRQVTHEQFMEVADMIVEAHCGRAC
jgi:CubicO group peptidase (beta-lactamase class C family)